MAWTVESKLDALLRLPWTIDVERNAEDGYVVLRAREVPSSLATGTEESVEAEFWSSLRASLACYLEFNDPIPLPRGVSALPWDMPPAVPRAVMSGRPSEVVYAQTTSVAGGFLAAT